MQSIQQTFHKTIRFLESKPTYKQSYYLAVFTLAVYMVITEYNISTWRETVRNYQTVNQKWTEFGKYCVPFILKKENAINRIE